MGSAAIPLIGGTLIGNAYTGHKQQKRQRRAMDQQNRMVQEREKKIADREKMMQRKESDRRRAQLGARSGRGRQSLYYQGNQLGVESGTGLRDTLG